MTVLDRFAGALFWAIISTVDSSHPAYEAQKALMDAGRYKLASSKLAKGRHGNMLVGKVKMSWEVAKSGLSISIKLTDESPDGSCAGQLAKIQQLWHEHGITC